MTDESVRPALNAFGFFFQCDDTAAVPSENKSGPKCDGQTDDRQNSSRPYDRRYIGNDARIERVRQSSIEEKEKSDHQQYPVTQPLRLGFAIHCALGRYCSDGPGRDKDDPAISDNNPD